MSALSIEPIAQDFYVVGGTMRPDAQSYVRRDADEKLYEGLLENEFCHVLTARQMGKSSLMLRTAARLREAEIGVAALDLTGIGTNLTPEQWYSGLIVQLGDRLKLEDQLLEFWVANAHLGPMQRWVSAIRKVVLPEHTGRLAIFIDEIDAVASLSFSTDEFFAGIRECYNLRNENADINRLTFCLLGVANPSDLIRDTRTTPFNVGRRIELNDFTEQEAAPLATGLGRSALENQSLLRRVFHWTNGHPYLTQRLCKAIFENGNQGSAREIDESIEQMFFTKRAQEYDDNLIFVRERLLRSGVDVAAVLNLYSRIRRSKRVVDDDSQPLVDVMRLSGITRAEEGRLCVRNRIYERVFNNEWIKANLPGAELRRQRAAFRRGVIRTTGVAGVILVIVASLAITAFRQRNLALQQTAVNNQLLYRARMKLALQEYETANLARVETLVEQTTPQPGETDLRGFEWFLFWRYAHDEVQRITETGRIANARFVGNDTIAFAEVIHTMTQQKREYLIKFYDRAARKESASFRVPAGTFFDVAVFSPDNKLLATDAPDNSVVLWDLASKKQLLTFPGMGPDSENGVSSIAFAPDQKFLAASFANGKFKVWDLGSGKPTIDEQSTQKRPAIAFSANGKFVAVGTRENGADVLDVATGKPLRTISFPKGPISLMFFSPDGNKLIAATSKGKLYGWDMLNHRLLDGFTENHTNEVMSFSFSPNGKTLATGSVDRTVKLWDLDSGKYLRTILGHGGWVTALHFSADGRYLLSGDADGLIKVWDMTIRELPVWPDQKAKSIAETAFTPAQKLIAIGRTAEGQLNLWDLSNGKVLFDLGHSNSIDRAAFSTDASLVALAVGSQLRVYSVATGNLISTRATSGNGVYSVEFSPDGTSVLSCDRDGNIIVSTVANGGSEASLNSGNGYYRAVFSPDGKLIASADQDGQIRIWNLASQKIDKTLRGHTSVVKFISFSPDGKLLASAGEDNTVRIWDLSSEQELQVPIHSSFVERLAFTPDGKRLLTAAYDGAVILWDVAEMQEVITLQRRGDPPSCTKFSQNGLTLAVSDENGAIKVWQAGQPGS
ncbi:MAG TPA: AAA-like domain-containing protein [Pyrinomonadaceae bacterium]|nr:AAA-like domain-containing protein [Pyrinomonadaceae bacterium]